MDEKRIVNQLTSKEWLKFSFSIWRDIRKTPDEKKLNHPATFPVALCERIIRTFSQRNSVILDPFNGIGSSLLAAQNLGSTGVGIDLSREYCEVALSRIGKNDELKIIQGDSREELLGLSNDSFDLCITSPPYWNVLTEKRSADRKNNIVYSDSEVDIGNIEDYSTFIKKLGLIFEEVFRVLKPGSYCIVNVMDIRKKNKFYPFHIDLITELKGIGFILDDLIIWDRQSEYNNMRPLGYPYKFRINKVHEYLIIFYKEK